MMFPKYINMTEWLYISVRIILAESDRKQPKLALANRNVRSQENAKTRYGFSGTHISGS